MKVALVEKDDLASLIVLEPTVIAAATLPAAAAYPAARVLVMTERPGAVAAIYDVALPRPRDIAEVKVERGFASAPGGRQRHDGGRDERLDDRAVADGATNIAGAQRKSGSHAGRGRGASAIAARAGDERNLDRPLRAGRAPVVELDWIDAVPLQQSQSFVARMKEAGVPAELIVIWSETDRMYWECLWCARRLT